ncbi:MAG: YdjY domain-containing protein [Opitutales bacterium]
MTHPFTRPRFFAFLSFGLLGAALMLTAAESDTKKSSDSVVRLPGVEIHSEKGIVDVDGQIALTDGLLELVACTEGTKEHEAIVRIDALPIHVHTALLLIGARNGTPAMRKPINEEQTRWMHVRPSGQSIKVSLVLKDAEGEAVERPISDFIRRTEGDPYMPDMETETEESDEEKESFPNVFLFTGSHLVEGEEDNKQYLADQSGHVITISTFGDELLGLADIQSRENGELVWEVDPTHLPPLDTEVTLRLRPVFDEATGQEGG